MPRTRMIGASMRPLAALLLLALPAWADPPIPKITGPTSAVTGDIVLLNAGESGADFYDWLVDTSGVQVPSDGNTINAMQMVEVLRGLGYSVDAPTSSSAPQTYVIFDGGKRVLLASYPGTWRISLACSNAEGVKQIPWKVVVRPTGTNPTPPPTPPPPTPPPLNLDLSAQAKQWYATVPADARGRTANVKETIHEIGTRAKEIGAIEACDVLLALGLSASFERDAAKWAQFSKSADAALAVLKSKGVTVEQYGQALVSIADGLRTMTAEEEAAFRQREQQKLLDAMGGK